MKKLLLHTCCGPCSTAVLERLKDEFDITLFFYNPNILPEAEYQRRLKAQEAAARWVDVSLIAPPYDSARFFAVTAGLEAELEGGARCARCFAFRLEETARRAKAGGFDCFATTLSIGPTKDAALLNQIGTAVSQQYGVPYLPADFKKQGGYQRSVALSKELGLYRQNYCGCKKAET